MKTKIKRTALILMILALLMPICSAVSVNTEAKVRINKKRLPMIMSEHYKLKLKGFKKKITWKSSNPEIAKVGKKGVVTAVSKGRAVITAKADRKKYSCIIVVKEKESQTSPYIPAAYTTPDPNQTEQMVLGVQYYSVFYDYYVSDKGKNFIEISNDAGKSLYLERGYSVKVVYDGRVNVKGGNAGLDDNFIEGTEMKYSDVKIGDIVDVVYDYWPYSPIENQSLGCMGINVHAENTK